MDRPPVYTLLGRPGSASPVGHALLGRRAVSWNPKRAEKPRRTRQPSEERDGHAPPQPGGEELAELAADRADHRFAPSWPVTASRSAGLRPARRRAASPRLRLVPSVRQKYRASRSARWAAARRPADPRAGRRRRRGAGRWCRRRASRPPATVLVTSATRSAPARAAASRSATSAPGLPSSSVIVPARTRRPLAMMTTSSTVWATSWRRWLEMRMVLPWPRGA